MAKDYVRRKPASKRGKAGAKRGKQSQQRPFPIVAVIILIATVTGFAWLLYSIKGHAPQPGLLPEAVAPKPNVKVTEPLNPLPQKPQERPYIRELETKEVEVEVDTSRTKSTRPYQMQCASFRNQSDAQAMKATIAFTGLSSQVKRSEGKNGVWYRVVLGPYTYKRNAETDRHKLQRAGIDTCQIWHWNWN